jgi:hypothetical protein
MSGHSPQRIKTKVIVKRQERNLIDMAMLERWSSSILAHLQGTDMRFRFKQRNNWGKR